MFGNTPNLQSDSIKKNNGSPPTPVHPFVHMNLEKDNKGIVSKITFYLKTRSLKGVLITPNFHGAYTAWLYSILSYL